ncbi:DUF1566 domain-containing protein [Desulfobotulus mexicanus]|uniref:DUF1566 domain-containing protein n=1 Tax=Desulfobotulus mexicanus TaxID=2586642 RepID=A0A5S5MC29_9BACT|nr:DUF1566 domain-containing protein [Desulfobotulus mexicanus]TYT73209.1 DUF1566 domain-containing protein [Desulfobotulus mexicanus]
MKEKRVQMKGCFKKNLLIVMGLLMFYCSAGVVQAGNTRFQEVEGSNGSIVRDNNTRLEWQRCPHGQSWTGSGCSGTAWEGPWDYAMRITASAGFRVPTIDELKTLAPYDQNIFPGVYGFWSSSPYAYDSDYAWYLSFSYRHVYGNYKSYAYRVRLVRGGQ